LHVRSIQIYGARLLQELYDAHSDLISFQMQMWSVFTRLLETPAIASIFQAGITRRQINGKGKQAFTSQLSVPPVKALSHHLPLNIS
jgi:hypothetical protein